MTQHCPLCQKISSFTGVYVPVPDPVDWCTCGGVAALQKRLRDAERLLHVVSGMWHSRASPPGELWEGACHREIDAFLKGGK